MGIINIEGLGEIEIQGDTPNAEEEKAIVDALGGTDDPIALPSTDIEDQYLDNIPDPDVEKGLETETAIPEIIDPGLAEIGKPQGLEKIGGRPTFEAAGAIGGSVISGATLTPASSVAGGTLGAVGMGQLYDVLQSAITDEPTDFGTQIGKVKSDLQEKQLYKLFLLKCLQ